MLLDALIDEAGMSHDGFASRVNQAGCRHGLVLLYDHASVRRWIRDATVPRGRVPELICEVLSMRLGRTVTLPDAGLDRGVAEGDGTPLAKAVDAATALWRSDFKQAAALRAAQPLQGPAAIAPVFAGAFGFGVAFVEGVITVGPTSVCGLRTAPPSENPVVAPTREPAIPRTNWPG